MGEVRSNFERRVQEIKTDICECDILSICAFSILSSTDSFVTNQETKDIIEIGPSGQYPQITFVRHDEPFILRLLKIYDSVTIMATYKGQNSILNVDLKCFIKSETFTKSRDLVIFVNKWCFKFNIFVSRFRNVILHRLLGENIEDAHFSTLPVNAKLHVLSFLSVRPLPIGLKIHLLSLFTRQILQ